MLTLVTGTSVAQAIAIGVSPVLTRLYTPSDFGVFAVYGAVASIVGAMATLRYELAIMLPVEEREAAALLRLCIVVTLAVAVAVAIVVLLLGREIASALGNADVRPWLYLLPVSIALTGLYQSIRFWCNRNVAYKRIARSLVYQRGGTAATQVGIGAFIAGPGGMVVGSLVGPAIATFGLGLPLIRGKRKSVKAMNWGEMWRAAWRYRSHPFHLLPAQAVGVVALRLPVFILSRAFDAATVGFFSLAYRLVTLPTVLIGNAIGEVYRQKVTVAYNTRGEFRREFIGTVKVTGLIAILPTVVFFIFSPMIFAFVFGPGWRVAGEYARILCVASFFELVFTPVDKNALVVGATRYIASWHFARFLALCGLFAVTMRVGLSVYVFLWIFVAINAVLYSVEGVMGYRFCLGSRGTGPQ